MAAGRTLRNYEILDELGRGGMGTVYRARDVVLERIVAVKVLHFDPASNSTEGGSRFLNEARAIARLNHPAIVSVFEFSDSDPQTVFIAMEYVEGATIDTHVRCREGDDVESTLDLACQLLSGLGYAHDRGVVHRDIKPSNLLVTREGKLKITDFGIAKLDSLKHTQAGVMVGTPAYMAPERFLGGGIGPRCDVYSVGVLCYELLTGRRPFGGALTEMVYQICHVEPASVTALRPTLPESLGPIISKALAKDPAARYQSAEDFRAALDTLLRRPASGATAPGASRTEVTAAVGPTLAAADTQPAQTDAPPGWSVEDIAEVVRHLATILGPLAKVTVKRAAAQTRDRAELYEILGRELRSDDERRRFMAAAPRTAGKLASTALAPTTLERAAKILARYIGPIATVIVNKAAAGVADEAQLYARLAERIADPGERARCEEELRRGG